MSPLLNTYHLSDRPGRFQDEPFTLCVKGWSCDRALSHPMETHPTLSESSVVPSSAFDIVAIATSAGGLSALIRLVGMLPATFPTAIAIVQHLAPNSPCLLPGILAQHTPLTVKLAQSGEPIHPGIIYVAPTDYHLQVQGDRTFALNQSERVNFSRPSADLLFESVAAHFGQRAIAVILTGRGQDGARGIQAVKQQGGVTIAQDPATAEFSDMPQSAIRTHAVDLILPLDGIAPHLLRLVTPSPNRS